MKHVTLHNNRSALANRAGDQGADIHAFSEYDKASYLLRGIHDKSLDACMNAIIADGDGLRKNFDHAVRHFRDYFETTRNSNNSSLNNRNISAVGGQHGRGGGGSSSGRGFQGKGRGTRGRGENGGRVKKKPWVQALVDKCTDITELSYPHNVYKDFDEN